MGNTSGFQKKKEICLFGTVLESHLCFPPLTDPLRVTLSPKNLKTGISSTLFFTCTVEGSPEYTITWFRNTELIVPDQHISIQGQNNDTLQITAAQKFHSGAYQCFASRKGHATQDFSIILLEGMSEEAARILNYAVLLNCFSLYICSLK